MQNIGLYKVGVVEDDMKEMRLLAERDSVCMGDDCTAPNGEYIQYKRGIRLSELLLQIVGYVPDYSGRQHAIWGIERKGVPIAFLECDEHRRISDLVRAAVALTTSYW